MRARRIIEGASFGPEVLKVVSQAFDEAWASVAPTFTAGEHDDAREALAHAVMSAARQDSNDVATIRDAAVRAFMRHYGPRFGDSSPFSRLGSKSG